LEISDFTIVEGSGISRMNRISARSLLRVVEAFEPYHDLLRRRNDEYFKTGTLKGISARAGYFNHPAGGFYRFVIISNTPGRSAEKIKQALVSYVIRNIQ
jgi:D-alanyl-D-alanine carboxypeptidase/D-alanyl-D-alanine-endopeptidase (penicillin-binding protein 4)